jgi:hypothetical protein
MDQWTHGHLLGIRSSSHLAGLRSRPGPARRPRPWHGAGASGFLPKDLHLSYGTVKTDVARILAKTGARDRVQAVVVAYESG